MKEKVNNQVLFDQVALYLSAANLLADQAGTPALLWILVLREMSALQMASAAPERLLTLLWCAAHI